MLTLREIPEKALTAAYEYVKTASDKWERGVSAYVVLDKDGERSQDEEDGYPCHAGLNRMENETELVGSAMGKRHRTDEDSAIPFLTWLFTESPMSKFIVNRDDLSSCLEGGIIIDARSSGCNAALFICKAGRYTTEEPYRAKHWKKLVDLGVDPMIAFNACSVLNEQGGVHAAGYCTHAQVMTQPQTIKDIHELLTKDLEVYKDQSGGGKIEQNCCKLFYKTVSDNWNRNVSKGLFHGVKQGKKIKVPDGWGGYIEKESPGSWAELAETCKKLESEARKLIKGDGEKNDNVVVELAAIPAADRKQEKPIDRINLNKAKRAGGQRG